MIPNGDIWNCLAVKKLSILFRAIMSKHDGNFYCLNCLYSFTTENKLEPHKKVSKNKSFCGANMPSQEAQILEFNQYQQSDKATFITYADLECLIKKVDGCKNNPENSSTSKVSKHIPLGFSMSTISSFRSRGNKYNIYRGEDCESLRVHAIR